ncbi:MAG: hypothetical protein JO225_10850 [Candidatus Eremiobacteraeota bacterium]|nr:hypothetical protein [Candidatus Eremiobacteraeota bacterium]
MQASGWFRGRDGATGPVDRAWRWPRFAFGPSPTWPAGAYTACLIPDGAERTTTPDARTARALFVVPSERAHLAVNLPLFTYHAYNVALGEGEKGECLYSGARAVTLHRPGGGNGGRLWDERHVDRYDPSSPRQTFAHWDAPALAWLERQGYAPAVCTDLDLHHGRLPLDLRALLFFGHQEYWTREMRTTVDAFVRSGGSVAFLCGNTMWFRVRYDADRHAIVRDGTWSDDDPEEALTGTSYRFGGGRWGGERPPTGFTVRDPDHWVFAGTTLRRGQRFAEAEHLIGYECDGTAAKDEGASLATASLATWPVADDGGEVLGGRAAMRLRKLGHGTIFTAATVDWPRVLAHGEPHVERITRNVIDRFLADP